MRLAREKQIAYGCQVQTLDTGRRHIPMSRYSEFESFGEWEEEREERALTRDLACLFPRSFDAGPPSNRRQRTQVAMPARAEWAELEESGGAPLFEIDCRACPIKDCQPALRRAMLEAIRLATNAANKLDVASSLATRAGNSVANQTAQTFMKFFCHDPSLPLDPGGEASGANVAKRLRAVAKELGGGRKLKFVCLPQKEICDVNSCCPTEVARIRHGEPAILCDEFWKESDLDALPTVDKRAAALIHEMLHLLFGSTVRERGIVDMGPPRAVADCYEAFVLEVNGFVALRGKCKKCK
jgi:hypothetical protein